MIHATAIGNLGRDAELKHIPSGKAVLSFSVAAAGRSKDQTTWVRCSLWGARGEKLAQHLTKGSRVGVSGTLSTREHDGKTYVELDVQEIELLGGNRQDRPVPRAAENLDDDAQIPF